MDIFLKRELLFRGKRKDNGEWVTGQLSLQQPPVVLDRLDYFIKFSDYYIEVNNIRYLIVPETLGRYTGFNTYSNYDDELHKIFSGDLCYVTEFDFEGKDTQHLCRVIFGCENDTYFTDVNSDWCIAFNDVNDIESDIKLIGNIYDNPELL